mgnify:CR=1 FL=1
MKDIVSYTKIALENQSVDEIVEDIGILKKIEEASKFEIGRRLVYLKETCKHGEYLPKLEKIGLTRATASIYVNFYCRFGQLSNVVGTQHLGYQKIRELLRIPKGSEEEYLNKIPNPNEVTAKQLREEIDKLREEKEQEKLAKEVLIKNNQELQEQLEKEKKTKKTEYITNEVVVEPSDYSFIKDRLHELECSNKALENEKDEEIERLNDELDKANRDIEEKEELIKKLNKYNLTEKEIDTANIKFEQSSQSITLAVEVEYNVQKIISEISKLKISDLYNNADEVVYRDSVLKIVYLAQNELNKIINELSPNEKVSTYNNQDIIEGVYYHE